MGRVLQAGTEVCQINIIQGGNKIDFFVRHGQNEFPYSESLTVHLNLHFRTENLFFTHLRVGIGIHTSDTLLRFRDGNLFEMYTEREGDNLFGIDSQLIDIRLLKYPFESNCVDYHGKEFESRSECFEVCYGGREGRSNGQHGFITTDNYDLLKYEMFYGNQKMYKNLEEKCYEKCRTDCITKRYHGSLVSKFAVEGVDELLGIFLLSTYPTITVNMVQSFGMHSFIIYFASVIGLWFGCSIFSTVIDFFKFGFDR